MQTSMLMLTGNVCESVKPLFDFSLSLCSLFCVRFSCKNLIDLRKHFDTHSSEPAYHCDFEDCDYSTRSMQSIKSHYKRVHEVRQITMHSFLILYTSTYGVDINAYSMLSFYSDFTQMGKMGKCWRKVFCFFNKRLSL